MFSYATGFGPFLHQEYQGRSPTHKFPSLSFGPFIYHHSLPMSTPRATLLAPCLLPLLSSTLLFLEEVSLIFSFMNHPFRFQSKCIPTIRQACIYSIALATPPSLTHWEEAACSGPLSLDVAELGIVCRSVWCHVQCSFCHTKLPSLWNQKTLLRKLPRSPQNELYLSFTPSMPHIQSICQHLDDLQLATHRQSTVWTFHLCWSQYVPLNWHKIWLVCENAERGPGGKTSFSRV